MGVERDVPRRVPKQGGKAICEVGSPCYVAVVAVELGVVRGVTLCDQHVAEVPVGVQLIRDLHQTRADGEPHSPQRAARELPGASVIV